jgi:hypothetical protein
MNLKNIPANIFVLILFMLLSPMALATDEFIGIESVFRKPLQVLNINRFAINLASYPQPVNFKSVNNLNKINDNLIYQVKVKVKSNIYYRVVTGNYETQALAKRELDKLKGLFPGAWIYSRSRNEQKKIKEQVTVVDKRLPAKKEVKIKQSASSTQFANKLLSQARQELIDQNYARVITISDKVIEVGDEIQKQRAMELSGIARERQRKFAQAIAIYTEFLNLYPESKLSAKIRDRLNGLKTMRLEPKKRLAKKQRDSKESSWNIYGSFSQYYRDDVIDQENEDSEEVNSTLVSDINLFARRKSDKEVLVLRFDGGVVNDFIDDESDSRISRAMISYSNENSDYQVIGGRQSRTAKGVLGRFDGLIFNSLNHDVDYSVYLGYPVQSSYDDIKTDRQFFGGSLNFSPLNKLEMDVYLVHQEVSGLTDRQAIGTEFQYRNDKGFLFGIIDYDTFYSELNNITAITNYRVNEKWVLNLTYDYRNSPLLTTLNALQGQSVEDIDGLKVLFSDDEIYQFAQDRTSKSQNLFAGSSYQIDDKHQLYLSLSLSSIEATEASGGVSEVPASNDTHIAGDYTIRGYFFTDDYTTFGLRLSSTSSSDILSLRTRSRFAGTKNLRYDPRLRLDYRKSKDSDVDQWILKPSFKLTYKPNKKISLEASIGIEYSNFELPELNDQVAYNLFMGYVYQF